MATIARPEAATLSIQPLQAADLDRLHAGPLASHRRETVAEIIETLLGWEQQDRGWALTVHHGDQIVGYGQLVRWGAEVEISDLVVTDSERGQGIGTRLILALMALARRKGYARVEIGVAESNPRALALYRRLGFEPLRVVTLDIGAGPEPVVYLARSTDLAPAPW